MVSTLSEDTFIFNALSPTITDMDVVFEALDSFLLLKQGMDATDRYNFIVYTTDGRPNFLEDFTTNPNIILEELKKLVNNMIREDVNVAGGIFTAVTMIVDTWKTVPDKCFRLIILTDSRSLPIPTPYLLELQKIVDKVFTFPFFLDVVRLNIDDTEEDKKLMSLAKRCNGEIHEINSMDTMGDILEVLAIKRPIFSESLPVRGYIQIPKANESFYENLGEPMIAYEEKEKCSICFSEDEGPLMQCPNCLSIAHKVCLANWAKKAHIGMRNVFRCHHCYYLLKLDREFIENVETGKIKAGQPVKVKKVGIKAFMEKHGLVLNPEVKQIQDPLGVIIIEKETIPLNQSSQKEISKSEATVLLKNRIRTKVKAKDQDIKVMPCINCGKIITSAFSECPKCHFPLM